MFLPKIFPAVFLFLALLPSCRYRERDPLKIEKDVYFCMAESYKKAGADLDAELLCFEDYLIETGVMSDHSGASIYEVYQKMRDEAEHPVKVDQSFSILIGVPPELMTKCLEDKDVMNSVRVAHPILTELLNGLEAGVYFHPDGRTWHATDLMKVSSPEDFDREPIRSLALLTFYYNAEMVSRVTVDDKELQIILQRGEKMTIDNREIPLKDLEDQIRIYWFRYGRDAKIVLVGPALVNQNYLKDVVIKIEAIRQRIQDEESKKIYGKGRKQLSPEEKKKLDREILPFRMRSLTQ